jgi:hypothetical protein
LPVRLNRFQMHHIDNIGLFIDRIFPGPIHAVKRIALGLQFSTSGFRKELGASGLELLTGSECVIVEIGFWPQFFPRTEINKM